MERIKMFFSKSKKETKTEKTTKLKDKERITISRSDGNLSSTVTSMTRQISTSTQSSHIVSSRTRTELSTVKSPKSTKSDVPLDAIPFQAKPPRSAFTSEPYTGRNVQSSQFNRYQPTRASAFATSPPNWLPPKGFPFHQETRIPEPSNRSQERNGPKDDIFRNKVKVKVVKSQAFLDDPTKSKVPVYRTRSKNRGQLFLVNNIKFAQGDERVGAELDEKNVVALFKGIGFEVRKYQNLSKKDMEKNIIKFRDDKTLHKFDIAVVIIMSHGTGTDVGNRTQVVCSDDQLIDTSWIINQFDNNRCKALESKPKIFIFQCCRGANINTIQHDSVPFPSARQHSDILLAYSTIPGFVSHRDPTTGTWYIQAICKVFMEDAHDTDVESLLKMVDLKLSHLVSDGSKQTSSFENRGFKTCYLHPQLYE